MRENFLLEFDGFGGAPSRCHVKILASPNKPIVIMCSQVKSNPGTSIMNAYEIIRERVFTFLAENYRNKQKEKAAESIDELSRVLESTKKLRIALVIYILKFASSSLRSNPSLLKQINSEAPEVIWLEHWPEGIGSRG